MHYAINHISKNGLSCVQKKAIIWTNADLILYCWLDPCWQIAVKFASNLQENYLGKVVCKLYDILSEPQCLSLQAMEVIQAWTDDYIINPYSVSASSTSDNMTWDKIYFKWDTVDK